MQTKKDKEIKWTRTLSQEDATEIPTVEDVIVEEEETTIKEKANLDISEDRLDD